MDVKFGALLIISAQICYSLTTWDENDNNGEHCYCHLNFDPVCGSDGNTYDNECFLHCTAIKSRLLTTVVKYGQCDDNSPTPDPDFQPAENLSLADYRRFHNSR